MFEPTLPRFEKRPQASQPQANILGELGMANPSSSLRSGNMHQSDFLLSQKGKYENPLNISTVSIPISGAVSSHPDSLKEVYETVVHVRMKSLEREEHLAPLNFKVIQVQGNQHTQCKIVIQLTNPSSLLFLYILEVSESDFVHLKTEQALLIDFASFPSKLIEMLELCLIPPESHGMDEKVKFVCTLDASKKPGEAAFNIVETNQFKALTHLTLRLKAASDEVIKKFLAQNLNKKQSENEGLMSRLGATEEHLRRREGELQSVYQDLQRISNEKEKLVERMQLEEEKKLSALRQESLAKEERALKLHEELMRETTDRNEKIIRELRQKLEDTQKMGQETSTAKVDLESREREQRNRAKALENELGLALKENERLRTENKLLDETRFQNEKALTELRVRCEAFEKQIGDKDKIQRQNQEMIETLGEQKKQMEGEVVNQRKMAEKTERKLRDCMEEINKANDIIEKLQNDIRKKKQQIKVKNGIVIQQESSITSQQQALEEFKRRVFDAKRDSEMKDVRIKELEVKGEELKAKIEESQKIIESNQGMIQYLNKTLNDLQKPSTRYAAFASGGQTSSLYGPSSTVDAHYNLNLNGPRDLMNTRELSSQVGLNSHPNRDLSSSNANNRDLISRDVSTNSLSSIRISSLGAGGPRPVKYTPPPN